MKKLTGITAALLMMTTVPAAAAGLVQTKLL
jgi:hypothetical protein